MDGILFSFLKKKNTIRPNPSPNSSGLSSQNSLIRAIEVKTGPVFRQPLYSDEILLALPQSKIKFKPARIADHDALISQVTGGAVSPISACEALHALIVREFLLW
jgi:hypothetical protein